MKFFPSHAHLAGLALIGLTVASPVATFVSNSTSTVSNSTAPTNGTKTDSANPDGPTLLPAIHWDYPVNDIRNLAPKNSSDLYYSRDGVSDPQVEHLFASMSTTFQYRAVVLDHSSHVKTTSCTEEGITVSFHSIEAYRFACKSWAAVEEFVLVTYTDGCHSTENNKADQRTFWLTGGDKYLVFHEETNTISCKVKREIAIEHALYDVEIKWGTYYPPGPSSPGSGSGAFGAGSSGGNGSPAPFGSGSPGTSVGSPSVGSSGSAPGSGSASRDNNTSESVATNGSPCGNPSANKLHGLNTASCGAPDFDQQIDNALGYYDFGPNGYATSLSEYIPGVSFSGEENLGDDVIISRDHWLMKRGFWSALKRAASVFVKVVTAPVAIASKAIQAIPVVGKFIAEKATIEPKITGNADINVGPTNNADTPWGRGALLYSKSGQTQRITSDVALYCVDCGIKGHFVLAGSARFNVLDGLNGLKELKAGVNANIAAGLHIGLVAGATFSDKKSKSLVNQAIPKLGLSVKNVFSAGVFVAVDAVATIDIKAQGQALMGVTMLIPNFQATLNLLDQDGASKSSITGYTPTFQKRFEAAGSIAAEARLALPISINVGVQIIPIKLKKSIALIEQPSLYGNLTAAASSSSEAAVVDSCNNGIKYFANAQNDILFDFLGIKTFTLNHYESPPLLNGCKQFGSSTSPQLSRRYLQGRQTNSSEVVIADEDRTSFSQTDNTGNENDVVTDWLQDPNSAEFQKDAEKAQSAATAATDVEGFTYALVQETHNVFQLAPDDNGNLYAVRPGAGGDNGGSYGGYLFAVYEGAVVGDDALRSLHYYPAEMSEYGVSRIRMSYEDHIPIGSDAIGLVPQNGALVAVTANSEAFGLVLCAFSNGADSQVFLVRDEAGQTTLLQEELRYTVTGAPATRCDAVALIVKEVPT